MSEPKLMLVRSRFGQREGGDRGIKQRWIADDFRAGSHRTREGARRAWHRRQRAADKAGIVKANTESREK